MKNNAIADPTLRDNFRNARLLIVEDNADHRFIIQTALQQTIPEVKTVLVANEAEAMSYLDQCRTDDWDMPKLVLLDLYMPDRQVGWRLLEHIRSLPTTMGKIPVVVFSNSSHRDDITESYQRGCSSYLVKPTLVSEWQHYFDQLRSYWWETVTLPKNRLSIF
jgi:CheY-like chemotaxis protein